MLALPTKATATPWANDNSRIAAIGPKQEYQSCVCRLNTVALVSSDRAVHAILHHLQDFVVPNTPKHVVFLELL